MNTISAIIIALGLVAASATYAHLSKPIAGYSMINAGSGSVWRLNNATGSLSACAVGSGKSVCVNVPGNFATPQNTKPAKNMFDKFDKK